MSNESQDNKVDVLLKDEQRSTRKVFIAAGSAGPGRGVRPPLPGDGRGRWLAAAFLGVLYVVLINVCAQSFEPRVEWVDGAGRTMLEDRPVFWPLILFAFLGRMLSGLVAWYPSFSDPTMGLFRVPDSPPLQKRRWLFRGLYGTGLGLALVTLVNNLAFSDVLGVVKAIALVVIILAGITLLFRMALLSFLSRLSVSIRQRR